MKYDYAQTASILSRNTITSPTILTKTDNLNGNNPTRQIATFPTLFICNLDINYYSYVHIISSIKTFLL